MTTRTSYLLRPLVALVALVAALAVLLIAYGASPARAAGSCSTTSGTTTCTFGPTGAEDTFQVPGGVSSVHVVATGAPGAVGQLGGTAGLGAEVSGELTVTPGQTLYVNVGGAPTNVAAGTCFGGVACVGGFNGGGSSAAGGGGGGASDVRTVSRNQSGSLESRLIVAGGGGGSGEGKNCGYPVYPLLSGGTGGHAGSDGGDGADGALCVDEGRLGEDPFYTAGGTGGEAGNQSAGGLGGSPLGQSGSLGLGGNGAALVLGGIGGSIRGGGGGGGLFGGGGGGSLVRTPDISGDFAPAGGGGGGSNLVPDDGTASTPSATTGPSIAISYTVPVGYDFQGFFSPVDNPEVLNKAKAGSAIPVKFSLGGDQGLDIFATGSPASRQIACDSADTLDALEETVTAGSSSLSYDATTDRYTYVWKTNKGWANSCRELVVKLDDATEHVADFKFVK